MQTLHLGPWSRAISTRLACYPAGSWPGESPCLCCPIAGGIRPARIPSRSVHKDAGFIMEINMKTGLVFQDSGASNLQTPAAK